jgi:hypothetical protein
MFLARAEFRGLDIKFVSYQNNIHTRSPLGQAVFTNVSAVAQLECDIIPDRVRVGLCNAGFTGAVTAFEPWGASNYNGLPWDLLARPVADASPYPAPVPRLSALYAVEPFTSSVLISASAIQEHASD